MKSQQSDKLFYKMGTVNNDDRKHGSKARSSIPKLLCHVQAIATLATRKSHFEVREGAKSQQLLGAAWLRAEHCTREKKLGDFQGSSFSYYLISVRHMTDWGAAAGVWHHALAARSKCTPTPSSQLKHARTLLVLQPGRRGGWAGWAGWEAACFPLRVQGEGNDVSG